MKFKNKAAERTYNYIFAKYLKFLSLQERGCIIFDENSERIEGRFITFGDRSPFKECALGIVDGNCCHSYVDVYKEDDGSISFDTLKKVKEELGSFWYVDPEYIKKVK